MNRQVQLLIFSILVAYLTLFHALGDLPYLGSDEPRYARIGEEMADSGDFITPHLEGRPWMEKPPLLFWLEALSFRAFSKSEFSARLPVAAAGLLAALAVGFFARFLETERAGIIAFLALLTNFLYVVYSRAASTDLLFSVTLAGALMCGFLASRTKNQIFPAASGFFLGLAVLAKGPVALILFAGVFGVYFLSVQTKAWSRLQLLLGASVLLLTAVPWFLLVWLENGHNFVMTFWVNHHLARFVTDLHHHHQPIWFYIPVLLVGLFPWSCFLGSAAVRMWRERRHLSAPRNHGLAFLWSWVCFPLLFFSLSSSKLPGYILPIAPPLVLVAALEWEKYLSGNISTYLPMKRQLACLSVFSVLFAAGLLLGFHYAYDSPLAGLSALPILFAGVLGQYEFRKRRPSALLTALVAGMTLTFALIHSLAFPVLAEFHSTRGLCLRAATRISSTEPLILYRFFHHTARYYTDFQTTTSSLNSPGELTSYVCRTNQDTFLVLTTEHGWDELSEMFDARLVRREGNFYLLEFGASSVFCPTDPESGREFMDEPGKRR